MDAVETGQLILHADSVVLVGYLYAAWTVHPSLYAHRYQHPTEKQMEQEQCTVTTPRSIQKRKSFTGCFLNNIVNAYRTKKN